jgi:GGDEF domain-containing protein
MISLLSHILKEFKQDYDGEVLLGHIGGDDFILIFHTLINEKVLSGICEEFDKRKIDLFDFHDVSRLKYEAVTRKGVKKDFPLTTISLSAFSNSNFQKSISSGELGQYAAELKAKVKKDNYANGKSGFIYERRMYGELY